VARKRIKAPFVVPPTWVKIKPLDGMSDNEVQEYLDDIFRLAARTGNPKAIQEEMLSAVIYYNKVIH
jgi:hypothetical protein